MLYIFSGVPGTGGIVRFAKFRGIFQRSLPPYAEWGVTP
jgi:hypothetical protein